MGSAAGNNFNCAGIVELLECSNDVFSEPLKRLARPGVVLVPELGHFCVVGLAAMAEVNLVLLGSVNFLQYVFREPFFESGMSELLQQNG